MAHGRRSNAGLVLIFGLALGASGLAALAVGCGGGEGSGVDKAKLPEGVRSSALEHESCEESGHKVELIDVNNDKKPDIKRVYDGSLEVCRITDLNRDGKPDMFEYYDKTGQLRRREADYDDNGIVNAIEYYEGGKLARRELDTTNQGRIDTWDFFDPATGNRVKRERDATGDGRIDQWWTYEGEKVTIAMDRNGDGQPDPESTVVLGAGGAAMTPAQADAGTPDATPAPASPSAGPPGELSPTGTVDAGPPQRGAAKR